MGVSSQLRISPVVIGGTDISLNLALSWNLKAIDMDNQSTTSHAHLPSHGPIACRRCFTGLDPVQEIGSWRIVNDPGAWGAATPKVLVLGFSKGFTQADASRAGRFEDIPFKGMRPRLSEVLLTLGALGPGERVDVKMVASERDIAFGSLVRCSLSRKNPKTRRLECTGAIMPKSFVEEITPVVRRCAESYLSDLPPSVRLVVMLGTGDTYIAGCRSLIRSIHREHFSDINDVAYRTGSVTWVHVSHPSGLNGHHPAWMAGEPTSVQGRKRLLALAAIKETVGEVLLT